MLERLLEEFTDLAVPALAQNPLALALHTRRMHKLRGSAGMLGAKAIQQLAGEAEAACAANETERAQALTARLCIELQRLNQNALPALAAARAKAEELPLAGAGELELQLVADLIGLLRQQSLSAMDRFNSISPQLRRHMTKDSYEIVRKHIDNLQFSDAALALEASQA